MINNNKIGRERVNGNKNNNVVRQATCVSVILSDITAVLLPQLA